MTYDLRPLQRPILMRIFNWAIVLLVCACGSGQAHAQQTGAIVVSACGTPPATYSAGQTQQITQDTTGTLCTVSGGSGGGGNVNVTQVNTNAVNTGPGASGTGTLRVTTSTDSTIGTLTSITDALPAGTNLLGKVGIDQTTPGTTNAVGAQGIYYSAPGSQTNNTYYPLQEDFRGNLRVSINSIGGTTGATITTPANATAYQAGLSTFSQNALSNGTTEDLATTLQASGTGAGLGVASVGIVPTSAASQGLTTVSAAGASTNVLKSTAGNVYSVNVVDSTTAGFVVIYDATSAPSSGTALTTALIRWCFQDAASNSLDKVFSPPLVMTNGAVELFSTSCTTYTAPAVAPIFMTGQVK